MNETIVLKLEGNLSTNFAGVSRLFNFYHKAKVYTDTIIFIDFYHLHWFDANLSALLGAILSKLNTENTLTFSTDLTYLEEKFDVLFRNGFFTSENLKQDDRQSTISFYQFNLSDDAGFIRYIEKDLMCHRGMPALTKEQSNEIIDSLIEMAHGLNISVVAEGVENSVQAQYLKNENCDELQGYFFSKPINAEAFEKILIKDEKLL